MTRNKNFKHSVRARMAETGENYTTARAALLEAALASDRSMGRPQGLSSRWEGLLEAFISSTVRRMGFDPGDDAPAVYGWSDYRAAQPDLTPEQVGALAERRVSPDELTAWRSLGDEATIELICDAADQRVTAAEAAPWREQEPGVSFRQIVDLARNGVRLAPRDGEHASSGGGRSGADWRTLLQEKKDLVEASFDAWDEAAPGVEPDEVLMAEVLRLTPDDYRTWKADHPDDGFEDYVDEAALSSVLPAKVAARLR